MDRAVALVRLGRMVASDQRPALSAEALSDLLDEFQQMDGDGRRPTDVGWVGTWALNAAAAEGWRRKAGIVAGDFTFTADDARYDKGAVLANCERMAAMYAAKDVGVLRVAKDESHYDTERLTASG